jgi:hypothetical protein
MVAWTNRAGRRTVDDGSEATRDVSSYDAAALKALRSASRSELLIAGRSSQVICRNGPPTTLTGHSRPALSPSATAAILPDVSYRATT